MELNVVISLSLSVCVSLSLFLSLSLSLSLSDLLAVFMYDLHCCDSSANERPTSNVACLTLARNHGSQRVIHLIQSFTNSPPWNLSFVRLKANMQQFLWEQLFALSLSLSSPLSLSLSLYYLTRG